MKIAVITDAHANLPALEAALQAIRAAGCDFLVHTGDAIGIGPHPAECLELLLATAEARLVMGNHEGYFVHGLPAPTPQGWGERQIAHHHWVHVQLNPQLRPVVAAWPYAIEEEFAGTRVAFIHHALDDTGRGFAPLAHRPAVEDLEAHLARHRSTVVFYGHDHAASDWQGRGRYINPGSLGCQTTATAPYCLMTIDGSGLVIERREVSYDDAALYEAFETRRVPDRRFIYEAFFGGRFAPPPGAGQD